jgi:hypothetical protein
MRTDIWRVALAAIAMSGAGAAGAFAQDGLRPSLSDEATAHPTDVAPNDTAENGDVTNSLSPPLDDATLGQALNFDPLTTSTVAKTIRRPGSSDNDLNWNRSTGANGAPLYTVKKPLQAPWDASIGADFNLASQAPVSFEPLKPLPGTGTDPGAGSAWANLDVPHVATLGVRAEPKADHSKFGSSLQRTLPLGQDFSLTVQGSVAVTELYAPVGGNPQTIGASPITPAKIWDTDNSVKLNIKRTGTAFSVGATTSSIDPLTHSRVTAEQNIYGPLNITGSLNDVGQTTASKSIGAGLKFDW